MKTHSLALKIILAAVVAMFCLPSFASDINTKDNRRGGMAIKLSTVKVTTAYTVKAEDELILADTTAGAITVTLPPAENGRVITVQKASVDLNAVTIDPPGATLVNAALTYSLAGPFQSVELRAYVSGSTTQWFATSAASEVRTQAVTATTTGATTGTILGDTTFATVTCDDANKIVILPAPTVGKTIILQNGATGYELRSSDPTTIAINTGTGTAAESAIPASSTVIIRCVSATAWKGVYFDPDSDQTKVEAAAP